MIIRRVHKSPEDFGNLCDFLLLHFAPEHQMGSLSASKIDCDKAALWVGRNVECAAWVVEENGDIVGSLGLHEQTPWYSNVLYLTDGWFYIRPEYRKNSSGRRMLEEAKKYAQERGLPLIMNIFNMEDTEIKIHAFQRMGLKLIGGSFMAGE